MALCWKENPFLFPNLCNKLEWNIKCIWKIATTTTTRANEEEEEHNISIIYVHFEWKKQRLIIKSHSWKSFFFQYYTTLFSILEKHTELYVIFFSLLVLFFIYIFFFLLQILQIIIIPSFLFSIDSHFLFLFLFSIFF